MVQLYGREAITVAISCALVIVAVAVLLLWGQIGDPNPVARHDCIALRDSVACDAWRGR